MVGSSTHERRRRLPMGPRVRATVLAIVLAILLAPMAARGQEWQFELTPYLWMRGIDGDVGVRGSPDVSVSADFSDIVKDLDFGAVVAFEGRKGPWGFLLDGVYLKTSKDGDTPGQAFSRIDVESRTAIITPVVGYQVFGGDAAALDVFVGARIWVVDTELKLTSGGVVPTQRFSETKAWADPVVGGRLRAALFGKLFASLFGDVGGFGVASDFTWQVFAGVGYQFTDRWSLKVGYRALGVDYESDGFRFDVIEHGPLIGLGVRF
jgi:opacity protein-like surface antigen